jgi:HD-like signal output (HDOD) protein
VFEFEAAEDAGLTANEAFNEFSEFIQEHWAIMDDDLRNICMLLADRLAESYHHTNAREKDMIRRLRDLLYTIHPVHSIKI